MATDLPSLLSGLLALQDSSPLDPPPLAWVLVGAGLLLSLIAGLCAWAGLGGRLLRALQRGEGRRTVAGGIVAGVLGGGLLLAGAYSLIGAPANWFEMAATRDNVVVPIVIAFARMVVIGTALWPPLLSIAVGMLLGAALGRTAQPASPLVRLGVFLGHSFAFWWPRGTNGHANGAEHDEDDAPQHEPEFELTLPSGASMPMEAEEREYIENILEFGDTTARDVMRPRPDVIALDVEWPASRIIETVAGSRHSRFPVYEDGIDNIIGVLHLRDLLEFLARGDEFDKLRLREILMEALFVPEGKKADDILRTLQRHKNHLAVVLDEYGGTAGILTIEDLLEEIVGEIQDEYDDEARLYYQREDGLGWVVDAQLPVSQLNELLSSQFSPDDVDTLGGLVLHGLGHIPDENEQLVIDAAGQPVATPSDETTEGPQYRLTVLSVDRNRIGQVLVERV